MTVIRIDRRHYAISQQYLDDLAGEFGGTVLIATAEDEYTTEFKFDGGNAAANAKAFRVALDGRFKKRVSGEAGESDGTGM